MGIIAVNYNMTSKTIIFLSLFSLCLSSLEAIEIKVATYKGNVTIYEINSFEKIIDLKSKIENLQKFKISDQELYLKTLRLDNDKRIDHYEIKTESNLTLYVISPDDNDGDKWKNETEELFGSLKGNPFSQPKHQIKITVEDKKKINVLFPGEVGSFYSLERSENMKSWFAPRILIIGNGGTIKHTQQTSKKHYFWRAKKI
jgi:hypothetical protein|tara:strand:- start:119 stop:721 length:603 start_codon:yes stop_codon:yes gene_type:complete